ncbi:MAG: DUF2513 domain-containing protein [Phormidesmis sp. CAN_BIN44]|nr:DUF2513 domain-containing protein [Phormidesmis sp. CAN_BIN44]
MIAGLTIYDCRSLQIESYNDAQIGYHTLLLLEAGFVEGQKIVAFGDSPSAIATRITWAGHEFLDEARDKGRWKDALRIVQEKGGGDCIHWNPDPGSFSLSKTVTWLKLNCQISPI